MTRRKATVVGASVGAVLLILVGLVLYTQLTALSYTGLQSALRAQGATVQDEGSVSPSPFLAGTDYILRVNGTEVNVYEYRTTIEATYDASRLSADGTTFAPRFGPFGDHAATVDFIAPPHWFRRGRVIVEYVGRQADLLALLRQVLGPQFAGF